MLDVADLRSVYSSYLTWETQRFKEVNDLRKSKDSNRYDDHCITHAITLFSCIARSSMDCAEAKISFPCRTSAVQICIIDVQYYVDNFKPWPFQPQNKVGSQAIP